VLSPRPSTLIALAWNLCVLALLVATGITCYPGLHHDCALYSTPAVNAAARGVWEVESYLPAVTSNLGATFNRHGQLYQWLMGKIFHAASFRKFMTWATVLTIMTFLSTLVLAWRMIGKGRPTHAPWLASGIAAMTALFCLWVQGRPEHLIPLLMLAPFAAHEWTVTRPWARWIGYAVLGLVVVTSPLPGVLCCLGVIAWIALHHRERLVSEVAKCAMVSISAATVVLLLASPVSPWQWALNSLSCTQGTPSNLGAFVTHLPDEMPFWNLVVIAAVLMLGAALVRGGLWWLGVLLGGVFYALLWKFQVYVLACFVPVLMLALVSAESRCLRLHAWLYRAAWVVVALASLASGRTLVLQALLVAAACQEGVTFAQTQTAVSELGAKLEPNEKLGFMWLARPSFVVFGQPGSGLISVEPEVLKNEPDLILQRYEATHHCRVRFVLVPQHGYALPAPPPPRVIGGGRFVLAKDGWDTRPLKLSTTTIAEHMPGYQFALYERAD